MSSQQRRASQMTAGVVFLSLCQFLFRNSEPFDAALFCEKDSDYAKQFPPKIRDREVRMTLDRLSGSLSVDAACKSLASKLGVGP